MSGNEGSAFTGSFGFFGAGRFAARCLELLLKWRPPSWIVTSPPSRAGRGNGLLPTPVEVFARFSLPGIPIVNSSFVSRDVSVIDLAERYQASFCFVIDFGQRIEAPFLSLGQAGCLNIHPSLLPRYRGAAPVQRALMDCAGETGVTVFRLSEGMDAGPVLLRETIQIGEDDDAGTLLERAALAATSAFIKHAQRLPIGVWTFEPQNDALATDAPKIRPEEERIDWGKSAEKICGVVRALAPKPGAWTTSRGRRLKVLKAARARLSSFGESASTGGLLGLAEGGVGVASGEGNVILKEVQLDGKKIQAAAEWWNGLRAASGERLL
ncbi:MAG: methionyl-tRNA formyltransferase [Synergistaceae bacterium]|jgi:methionyl-tRNA formyltransferase|nr:methionyl-tRNA formyltransferase [Synergistaceae bacterium]